MKIILDTNFLIYCAKEKINYPEEISDLINEDYSLVVPEQVINELEKLKNDKIKKVSYKDKKAADLALKLLKFNEITIIKTNGKTVDQSIINIAEKDNKNIVCTLDRGMRKILGRVILVNKKKRLILTR